MATEISTIVLAALVILLVAFSVLKPYFEALVNQVHVNTSPPLNIIPRGSSSSITRCIALGIIPCTRDPFHNSTAVAMTVLKIGFLPVISWPSAELTGVFFLPWKIRPTLLDHSKQSRRLWSAREHFVMYLTWLSTWKLDEVVVLSSKGAAAWQARRSKMFGLDIERFQLSWFKTKV